MAPSKCQFIGFPLQVYRVRFEDSFTRGNIPAVCY